MRSGWVRDGGQLPGLCSQVSRGYGCMCMRRAACLVRCIHVSPKNHLNVQRLPRWPACPDAGYYGAEPSLIWCLLLLQPPCPDAVYVWEVSTCRLLLELCKAAPRAKGASSARRANVPTPANGAAGGGGGGEEAAAAAVSGGVSDPDGPVTALALSPGGSRAAAGHGG